jgi:hypothetical protein
MGEGRVCRSNSRCLTVESDDGRSSDGDWLMVGLAIRRAIKERLEKWRREEGVRE